MSSTASPRGPRSPGRSTRPRGRRRDSGSRSPRRGSSWRSSRSSHCPATAYETGVACVTLDLRRANPRAKDTRFIATARAAYRRLPAGIEEGLLVEKGAILEGLSSNFFAVVDGALHTEEERVLLGVTRSLVLEVAEGLLRVERRAVRVAELPRVSEAFITSVSRGVLPVVHVDGQPLCDGRVGPITRRVVRSFAALVAREAEAL